MDDSWTIKDSINTPKDVVIDPGMEERLRVARTVPDAKVPIHTNDDVLRNYPGERG